MFDAFTWKVYDFLKSYFWIFSHSLVVMLLIWRSLLSACRLFSSMNIVCNCCMFFLGYGICDPWVGSPRVCKFCDDDIGA